MRIEKIILATAAATCVLVSAALAQQADAGTVTKVDRIHGTLAIRQTQDGTVGANTGDATQELRVQESKLLDGVHAGDKVTFSTTENNGVKTITKVQPQR